MSFVYLIKNGDLYKIGRTDNLQRRLKQLQPCTVIQTLETNRSRDLEYELHQKYKSRRLPQTEYFRLTPSEADDVCKALGGVSVSEADSGNAEWARKFHERWADKDYRREMERYYKQTQQNRF